MKIGVTVAVSAVARQVVELPLMVEEGSSVSEVLHASGLIANSQVAAGAVVGIWGKQVALGQIVREKDRIEVYRPLKVDPKVARRARFAKQGSRSAGLFASTRPGAKAGY